MFIAGMRVAADAHRQVPGSDKELFRDVAAQQAGYFAAAGFPFQRCTVPVPVSQDKFLNGLFCSRNSYIPPFRLLSLFFTLKTLKR